MLKKLCGKCCCVIDYNNVYCDDCKVIVDKQRDALAKDRYKRYNNRRLDAKEQQFYNSKEWRQTRTCILSRYHFMDVYEYYNSGEVKLANTVHHIVELKKDWNKRLDYNNLFPLNKENHKVIHSLIKVKGEIEVETMLNDMIQRFRNEFNLQEFNY